MFLGGKWTGFSKKGGALPYHAPPWLRACIKISLLAHVKMRKLSKTQFKIKYSRLNKKNSIEKNWNDNIINDFRGNICTELIFLVVFIVITHYIILVTRLLWKFVKWLKCPFCKCCLQVLFSFTLMNSSVFLVIPVIDDIAWHLLVECFYRCRSQFNSQYSIETWRAQGGAKISYYEF